MTGSPQASAERRLGGGLGLREALLEFLSPEPRVLVHGRTLYLRSPRASDYKAWAGIRSLSKNHLEPWEPVWAEDALTRAAFRRRLAAQNAEARAETGLGLFIFGRGDQRLIGGVTVGNVRRGVVQSASLGYWIGAPYVGRGAMTDALQALLPFLFDHFGLHRVEAACMPENAASRRVLEKAGFAYEGRARAYRKIAGQWRDHLLFAKLAQDPR
jgi:ribosomal-protein-alanine N-acetyltransferase